MNDVKKQLHDLLKDDMFVPGDLRLGTETVVVSAELVFSVHKSSGTRTITVRGFALRQRRALGTYDTRLAAPKELLRLVSRMLDGRDGPFDP